MTLLTPSVAPATKRRIQIVHVTLGLDMGGQEKLLVEFARHTNRADFDVRFVSLSDRSRLAEDLEAEGWPVVALGKPFGFRPGLILQLARRFREWQTDVVHSHDMRPLVHAAPAARLAGVSRVVHTRHGVLLQATRRQRWLQKLAARWTDHFVCISEDNARQSVHEGVPARHVNTIWNGIDVTRFAYAGPQPEGPAVTVARLSPEKNLETLLRAVALVVREEPSFRLEIAGDGSCMPDLQQLSRELGLEAHVRFLGQVRDVPTLLTRASLFVLPSLTEGISLTLLEAMARGLPVVTTRVGGNPEVVAEGETGLLVPPQDPASLSQAMLRLRRAPEESRRMGLAGRQRVEIHFDVRRMVAEYEALYLGSAVRDLRFAPAGAGASGHET